jgi:hypothetical protein
VIAADDIILSKGSQEHCVRDNVLFELGLFMGHLGRLRSLMLYDDDQRPRVPSDLAGITRIDYSLKRHDNDVAAALKEACNDIYEHIRQEGPFHDSIPNGETQGVLRVHEKFPRNDFFNLLRTAKRVNILQTWTPDIAYGMSDYAAHIQANETEINVYLLAPKELAVQRGIEQRNSKTWGQDQIKTTVNNLLHLRADTHPNVNVLLYETLPSLAIYRCTSEEYDIAYVGFYLKRAKAIDRPFFEIDLNQDSTWQDTTWRKLIDHEFSEVAKGAKTPDEYPELAG